ncbi:hypothetical protein RJD28_08185 [Oscillospiraceae bacterium NTUH-002-81]|nr:hypothetical protein RJD28_08185 [Oscillospiraceae bacterium NTUH-002-81]
MKKKLVTLILTTTMALSITACGGSNSSDSSKQNNITAQEETEAEQENLQEDTPEEADSINVDMDKCIEDLKEGLPLEPDYSFVRDYYIDVKDDTITITAVVDDATDPEKALDFADTLVRQLNLYANMQDSSIALGNKDFYGGLYEHYNALVGIAPASKTQDSKEWFVYDAISGGKTMLNLQKQYR